MHIVQIGYDDSVFVPGAASDTLKRQSAYAAALAAKCPGALMTYLVITGNPAFRAFRRDSLMCIPVPTPDRDQIPATLASTLGQLHAQMPVNLVSPQTVGEDGWGALKFGQKEGVPVLAQVHFDLFAPASIAANFGEGALGEKRHRSALRLLPKYSGVRVVGAGVRDAITAAHLHSEVEVIPVPSSMVGGPAPDLSAPRKKQVLFVGRLVPEKRVDRWLRVAAKVRERVADAQFLICGDGPLRGDLESAAAGLPVRFEGAVPYEKLPSRYSESAVFLLTSDAEGFGRVLAEAGFQGLPCVSTRTVGAAEIIEEGATGFLKDAADEDGLADAVARLLETPAMAAAMGAAASKHIAGRFAPAQVTGKLVDLWLKHANQDPPAPPPPPKTGIARTLKPTHSRYKFLTGMDRSLLRAMEYEIVAGIRLPGLTLDVGGGGRANYLPLLKIEGEVESVNIDAGMRPTHVADLNQPLPLPSDKYDNVISLNTLEHIKRDEVALGEIVRVLKPGGRFHIFVPFLYRVHASPSDYHRHTAFWWRDKLGELGITPDNLDILPLAWDALSSSAAICNFNGDAALRRNLLFHGLASDRAHRRAGVAAPDPSEFALGYYMTGIKTRPSEGAGTSVIHLSHWGETPYLWRDSDYCGVEEIAVEGEYDAVMRLLDKPEPVVVDAGANIGMFALRVLRAAPQAKIVSVEPSETTFGVLEMNRRLSAAPGWKALRAALWSADGSLAFSASAASTGSRLACFGKHAPGEEQVPAATLAAALAVLGAPESVDLIKLDIEGAEEEVLGAAAAILAKTRIAVVEIHPNLCSEKKVAAALAAAFPHLHSVPGRKSSKPLVVASRVPLGDLPVYTPPVA